MLKKNPATEDRNVTRGSDVGDKPPQGPGRLAGQLGAEESWPRSTATGVGGGKESPDTASALLRFYHMLHLNSDTVGWSPLDWLLREGGHVVRNTSRDTSSGVFLASTHSHLAPGWRKKGIPGKVCTHPFL